MQGAKPLPFFAHAAALPLTGSRVPAVPQYLSLQSPTTASLQAFYSLRETLVQLQGLSLPYLTLQDGLEPQSDSLEGPVALEKGMLSAGRKPVVRGTSLQTRTWQRLGAAQRKDT